MITVAFSTHRLEVLKKAETIMRTHDTVALEEPPHPNFYAMLEGHMSIQEYLEKSDYEFPRFARASCLLYRRLHAQGKHLLQVDPYLEHLNRLHDFFADGGDAHALDPKDAAYEVYHAERRATATLLDFYAKSVSAPFSDVVASVVAFARADAARIGLRDRMRAEALTVVAEGSESLYVECGYIHWSLFRHLQRLLGRRTRLRPLFLLDQEARRRIGKKQVLGPGDRLTLRLVFRENLRTPLLSLLAAQSLIFIKLVHKEEMSPSQGSFPHLDDEAQADRWTRCLSWKDCERLWPLVRQKPSQPAQDIVRSYLQERFNHDFEKLETVHPNATGGGFFDSLGLRRP
ncbi:hypothetical protein [Desulfosoma caldarium]|uniref:Uncharacterized protein n=1 Tax=Desulfosoma caldarium TaxID=610254 RepID=A0A3N1UPN5_9BACT|nr:hypothetical protein [Desulfosoma caldarium]ROQ92043.1 hypothetical protein EDC27_1714 [Desulfosoma caldarium]